MTEAWESEIEVKTRIEIARASFNKMSNKDISLHLRSRMLQCYVWPVVIYGCEAWTLKEATIKKLDAFEMWCYRRMLRISWVHRVTNKEVLRRAKRSRELTLTIKKKISYLGHVLRHERYRLLQVIMMGKVEGKRRAGRRRKSWLRNIREWTGVASVEQLMRLAKNKKKYDELTANLQ